MEQKQFETLILSLDKEKFHIICLQPAKDLDQDNVFTMAQQLSTIVRSNKIDAIILPFMDGRKVDIKSMDKREMKYLTKELIKFNKREEKNEGRQ